MCVCVWGGGMLSGSGMLNDAVVCCALLHCVMIAVLCCTVLCCDTSLSAG